MANNRETESSTTWMNVHQAAGYLGLSPKTIYQYVCDRRIPFVKIPTSNQVRFNRKQIDAWMENGQTGTITGLIFEKGG
jgi:excisionase family DNA binding protein